MPVQVQLLVQPDDAVPVRVECLATHPSVACTSSISSSSTGSSSGDDAAPSSVARVEMRAVALESSDVAAEVVASGSLPVLLAAPVVTPTLFPQVRPMTPPPTLRPVRPVVVQSPVRKRPAPSPAMTTPRQGDAVPPPVNVFHVFGQAAPIVPPTTPTRRVKGRAARTRAVERAVASPLIVTPPDSPVRPSSPHLSPKPRTPPCAPRRKCGMC
jgi:hypothetical protein